MTYEQLSSEPALLSNPANLPAKAWHFTRLGVTPSDPSELAAIEFAIPLGVKCEHPYEPINTLTHGLALSPDEKELWVTSLLDEARYVYEVKSQKIVARVPTGGGPHWVAFSPDGKYVCVSNAGSDDVSIMDAKARREVTRLKVGRVPKRIVAASVPPASAEPSASR